MLARYHMQRGRRTAPLPHGMRQDTRKHTRHILRPTPEIVETYLANPTAAAWRRFATGYRALLRQRFAADRDTFDALAEHATAGDVYLGCSCPTAKNPDVRRCHTWLALEFMQSKYPDLDAVFPD